MLSENIKNIIWKLFLIYTILINIYALVHLLVFEGPVFKIIEVIISLTLLLLPIVIIPFYTKSLVRNIIQYFKKNIFSEDIKINNAISDLENYDDWKNIEFKFGILFSKRNFLETLLKLKKIIKKDKYAQEIYRKIFLLSKIVVLYPLIFMLLFFFYLIKKYHGLSIEAMMGLFSGLILIILSAIILFKSYKKDIDFNT